MMEYFIRANSFAAPFFSDPLYNRKLGRPNHATLRVEALEKWRER